MSNIVKLKALKELVNKNYTLYLIWNVDKNTWYRPLDLEGLGRGVFKRKEDALYYGRNVKNKIIEICLENQVPEDLEIMYREFGYNEAKTKLRQIIEVFVFQDKKLKRSLKE